jgi:predicted adenine nucleotide alpha hydrolase (AANH) superfamily ATPase
MKQKILVHICCAPDALFVMGLLKQDYDTCGYFYNPNIYPWEEYELRLKETRKVAQTLNFKLIEETYDDDLWFKITEKYKDEPEKGKRCDICYAMRLKKTAQKASELGFDSFTTVMSLSPWKKADVLNQMGKMFAHKYKINFLEANFKKKDGFRKSVELSKQHGLYRQNYCGCKYSIRPA